MVCQFIHGPSKVNILNINSPNTEKAMMIDIHRGFILFVLSFVTKFTIRLIIDISKYVKPNTTTKMITIANGKNIIA